jgi:hypothetical protein
MKILIIGSVDSMGIIRNAVIAAQHTKVETLHIHQHRQHAICALGGEYDCPFNSVDKNRMCYCSKKDRCAHKQRMSV